MRRTIHEKKKTGNMSHKIDRIVNRDSFSYIVASLVVYLVFFLSGCAVKNEESTIENKNFAVPQPEMLEVSQPEFLEVSEPERLKVSQPEIMGQSEPKSSNVSKPQTMQTNPFEKGEYSPPKQNNPNYNRCANLTDFNERLKCTNEALGITQE